MKEICKQGYEVDELVSMLRSMLRIRMAEEQIGELVKKREIICPAHLSVGQEAIAVGVCSALTNNDYLFSTHRAHGHYLAKGGNLKAMMAEMFGRKTGCSGGRGGSMHLVQPDIGIMGTTSIVGGCFPIAVGAGLSLKLRDEKNISVVFFGDGAMDEGVFFESLNFAAIHKLPVLFVCENNYYATHMRICRRIRCDRQVNNLQQYEVCECDQLIKRVEAFNVPAKRVYGNDPVEVNKTARFMIDYIRSGQGPYFLDCLTYRWRGHVGPN
ncbi:MAG: thiamine pyrophosphate-dependent dehydrogenase E1 component subunit alpha, partial [Candidatus Margulisbacteria bacterium]|nr:thiamine pyrophosphate-dependent dehydrogenase E1 component subunit alpha [Candidatus Margulisiibacteriota bacterium]